MSASEKSVGGVESDIVNASGGTDSGSGQTEVNVSTSSDVVGTLNSTVTTAQSDKPINSDIPGEPDAVSETAESFNSDTLNTSDAVNKADAVNESDEPRPTRISAKQRREELESFKSEYLVPHKFEKKHNVAIEDEQWELLDLVVRRIGDRKANATSYLNAIIAAHLREVLPKMKEWVKL